ncbi:MULTISPECIES: LysR family transcriptional regulator [unclassified Beijerinckia]|uniref:LysR family transcriptional regulator n=1 Tax=unclassified Beijerinckia TaxID=2638183 RepID=UPI000B85635D|nr:MULTISPECIES: LysR family transcriptional regulator [unclassified Beijerinckia]
MESTWLADLQALAETLNFSRAAEKRNVTQPAFGRRIKSLEAWCGIALVDRTTHRLSFTPAGAIMLDVAKDVTRRLERARTELDQLRASTATLTFAATHALSFIFFPDWVRQIGGDALAIPMRLLSDNMNECERLMREGRAQFLLCHYHPDSTINLDKADFTHIELATDQLIPVTGKNAEGFPLYQLPGVPEAPVPRIAFEEKSGMGRILSSNLFLRTDQLHLTTVFTSHLAMVLKALAIDGKGVAWIPQSLAGDELGLEGRLTLAGPSQWAVPVKIVLFRPRARMSDVAEAFWAQVQSRFRR